MPSPTLHRSAVIAREAPARARDDVDVRVRPGVRERARGPPRRPAREGRAMRACRRLGFMPGDAFTSTSYLETPASYKLGMYAAWKYTYVSIDVYTPS